MQGNNYGLLVKTIKKFPKSPFRSAGRVLTFDKQQICSAINKVIPFTLQHDRELLFLGFISPYV